MWVTPLFAPNAHCKSRSKCGRQQAKTGTLSVAYAGFSASRDCPENGGWTASRRSAVTRTNRTRAWCYIPEIGYFRDSAARPIYTHRSLVTGRPDTRPVRGRDRRPAPIAPPQHVPPIHAPPAGTVCDRAPCHPIPLPVGAAHLNTRLTPPGISLVGVGRGFDSCRANFAGFFGP
jgi:hypothetical protein